MGFMQRAMQRGLQRRDVQVPQRIGVDETSFQKRHEYVTVINDLDGHMLHMADGRGKGSLEEFYNQFDGEQLAGVQTVAMDMWEPYIRGDQAVRAGGPGEDRVRQVPRCRTSWRRR